MRTKKAIYNIATSLLLQVVTIVCGFIIPRMIISTFGSDVNGLIASITQFLGYIALIEAGVGGVVRATLYKPLARHSTEQIQRVLKAADIFFKRIAGIFVMYMVLLAILYPFIAGGQFDYWFTFSLIIIIGISTFAQYYFGITYQLLLQSDQKQYVTSLIQVGVLIMNAFLVVILIKIGCNVILVKLVSSLVFVLRPLIVNLIVKKRYKINMHCEYDKKALPQKRDGLSHHIAYFLHSNTDIVILTFFSTMNEVSVYSVYYMIVSGVRKITTIFSSGLEATFGNMIANEEKENLRKKFNLVDVFFTMIASVAFLTAIISIESFIGIYTKGVTDANYQQPLLGVFLILAEYMYCIRGPYNSLIIGAGHFKETKKSAYIEAGLNIVLSIILVKFWGVCGVAFATFVAMTYRTIYYVYYLSKNLINRSIWLFVKKVFATVLAGGISVFICCVIGVFKDAYFYGAWAIDAAITFLVTLLVYFVVFWIFYKDDFSLMYEIILRPRRKSKRNIR